MTGLTQHQNRQLHDVRRLIAGSGTFAFEKNGTFFLYREVIGGRNTLILYSKDVDDFVRKVKHQAGASK